MLNFSFSLVFTIINFVVLFFLLRWILFKPISKFITARQNKINASLDEAKEMEAKAQDMSHRYQVLIEEANTEVDRLLKEGTLRGQNEAADLVSQARTEATSIRKNAEELAFREREKARQDLASDIARMATDVAAKILGQRGVEADAAAAEKLVRELEAGRAG